MIDSTDGSAKAKGDDFWYFSLYKFGGKPYYFIDVYSLLLRSILGKKELAALTGRIPELCGWGLWPHSVAGSCPPLVFSCGRTISDVDAFAFGGAR